MTQIRFFLLGAAATLLSAPAFALDSNPNADMEATVPTTLTVATGTAIPRDFAVRVVSASGHPVSGVQVAFFVDAVGHVPEVPDPSPPAGTYGTFAWPDGVPLYVRTGADGVATAPRFTAGVLPGVYDVAAYVFPSFDPQTNTLVGDGAFGISFHIRQSVGGVAPPDNYLIASPSADPTDVPIDPGAYADVSLTVKNTSAQASPELTLQLQPSFRYEQRSAPACGPLTQDPGSVPGMMLSTLAPIPAGGERTCVIRVHRDAPDIGSTYASWILLPATPDGWPHAVNLRFGSFVDFGLGATLASRTVDGDGVHSVVHLTAHNGSATAITPIIISAGCLLGRLQRVVAGACTMPEYPSCENFVSWPSIPSGTTAQCDIETTIALSDHAPEFGMQVSVLADSATGAWFFAPTTIVPLPLTFAIVDVNGFGLSGSWADPATASQGVVMNVVPDFYGAGHALMFGGWFTYDVTPNGGQRWYTLQGNVSGLTGDVSIYRTDGGTLDSSQATTTVRVGSAQAEFTDCSHGQLRYAFDDGRRGNIPLNRLLPNVLCAAGGVLLPPPGASYALAGTWADMSNSGQGFVLDVDPAHNILFGGWYTFASAGLMTPSAGQRWYTLQGTLDSAARGNGIAIYNSTGGLFDTAGQTSTLPVGSADISLQTCTTATLTYHFTSGENAGGSGTMELTRLGAPLPFCAM